MYLENNSFLLKHIFLLNFFFLVKESTYVEIKMFGKI